MDSAEFENEGGVRALLRRALGRSPIDAIGIFVLVIAAGAILINALYRQPGPHPAPRRIITDIQRELSRRGLYDGPVDGVLGPKTDSAIRDFEASAKLKATGEPTE